MLYPKFEELIAFKNVEFKRGSFSKKVKCMIPGWHSSSFRGQGLEFDAVRKYVSGDDIRSIDWRVTARKGSPHIKLFREEKERERFICFDMNSGMRFGTKKTFKSILGAKIAAFLGWQGLFENDRVGGCLFGDVLEGMQFFPVTRTKKAFCRMLKEMAEEPKARHEISFNEVLVRLENTVSSGSLIYVISDFSKQSEFDLSRLAKKGDVVFIALHDPADHTLFDASELLFSYGKESLQIDTANRKGRDAYRGEWEEGRKALIDSVSRFKIPLIEMSTEDEVEDLLFKMRVFERK